MNLREFYRRKAEKADYTDQELLRMIREGGTQRRRAVNFLFEHYFYLVRTALHKHRILDEDDVLVAYSEAIVALDSSIFEGKFQEKSLIKTFLTSIFQFKCIDAVRAKTTNQEESSNDSSYETETNDPPAPDPEMEALLASLNDFHPPRPGLEEPSVSQEEALILREEQQEERYTHRKLYQQIRQAMEELGEKCRGMILDDAAGFDKFELAEIYQLKDNRVASSTLYTCKKQLLTILNRLGIRRL